MPELIVQLGRAEGQAHGCEAAPALISHATALLLVHDGQPVADVSAHPGRWADLSLVRRALNCGVPVLGWGSGAALLGRALGAGVHTLAEHAGRASSWQQDPASETPADDALLVGSVPQEVKLAREVTTLPRGAHKLLGTADCPVLFRIGTSLGYAGVELPPPLLDGFLAHARLQTTRTPANALEELGGEQALREVLRDFYGRAREDEVLGPVFARHVHDWNAHLERALDFWVTALSGAARYRGNLDVAHAHLGLRAGHLTRWLALFEAACTAGLSPEHAAMLSTRARRMGRALGTKTTGTREMGARKSRERLTES